MDKVIIPESVRHEFNKFLIDTYFDVEQNPGESYSEFLNRFYAFSFDFQSGVYKRCLRSVGIEAHTENYFNGHYGAWVYEIDYSTQTGKQRFCEVYMYPQTAEIFAINEGFKLREQQLLNAERG